MKHHITLAFALLASIALTGCGGGIESNISQMTAASAEMRNACQSGDEESFLANADAMVSALFALKPHLEEAAASGSKQLDQYEKPITAAMKVLVGPSCMQMNIQIMSGPNASRLKAILNRMQNFQ